MRLRSEWLPAAFSLIACLGAARGQSTATSAPATRPVVPGHYVDPTYGFSMSVPAFAARAAERSVVVFFQGAPENGFASSVNVLVDPVKTTPDKYLGGWRAALKETNPGAKFKPLRQLQVSGREAVLADYEASAQGQRLRYLQLVIFDSEEVYVVTCTSTTVAYPKYEAVFRQCLESFKLSPR